MWRSNHLSLLQTHWNVWIRDQLHRIRSIITLPSHRRRDKSKITPLELSQLRALNGQLLWLDMQCLSQLLAPLSLLMGQTPQATVGTIHEMNTLARKATAWSRTPLKIHAHHSPIVVTCTDAGWTTRPDGNVDDWSSLQTPSCCKAENQTFL